MGLPQLSDINNNEVDDVQHGVSKVDVDSIYNSCQETGDGGHRFNAVRPDTTTATTRPVTGTSRLRSATATTKLGSSTNISRPGSAKTISRPATAKTISSSKNVNSDGHANDAATEGNSKVKLEVSNRANWLAIIGVVLVCTVISIITGVIVYHLVDGKHTSLVNVWNHLEAVQKKQNASDVASRDYQNTTDERLETIDDVIQALYEKQNASEMASHDYHTIIDTQIETLNNTLYTVKERVDVLEETLKELLTPVLFTARTPSDLSPAVGDTIKFGTIIQNVGNGYSTGTGLFTAPITGTYLFSAQMCTTASKVISYAVLANAQRISTAEHGEDAVDDVCSSTTGVALLVKGQTAYVQCAANDGNATVIEGKDLDRYWTMFTGVLIHPTV